VIVEELEELEDVQSCLGENVVEKASDLNDEWKHDVDVCESHSNIVVVLQHRAWLLEDWEPKRNLETRHDEVENEKDVEHSQVIVFLEVVTPIELFLVLIASCSTIQLPVTFDWDEPKDVNMDTNEHKPMEDELSLLLVGNLCPRVFHIVVIVTLVEAVQEFLGGS
jgi:hypothetical protein